MRSVYFLTYIVRISVPMSNVYGVFGSNFCRKRDHFSTTDNLQFMGEWISLMTKRGADSPQKVMFLLCLLCLWSPLPPPSPAPRLAQTYLSLPKSNS